MASGPERTYRQERVFAELVRFTPQLDGFDIAGALGSTDGSTRLTAYARLYACPEGALLPTLVEAAAGETIPFAQFWAFNAVGAVIDAIGPGNVQLATVRRLRDCLRALSPNAVDRADSLRTILGSLQEAAE
jgi:hypothetical protein